MKPLLIVEAPMGGMSISQMNKYFTRLRDTLKDLSDNEYRNLIVPSHRENFKFQTFFTDDETMEILEAKAKDKIDNIFKEEN